MEKNDILLYNRVSKLLQNSQRIKVLFLTFKYNLLGWKERE